jgi:glycosyltransferase involved in cell wall biosynthesis
MIPLSALIHTLNEADQIEECIRSVEWADEIYLLDSFSTDRTVEIVRERFPRVKIEQRKSLGSAAQKNYGMLQTRNAWVLVVDADERITPELRDEIVRLMQAPPPRWAWSIGRRNFVLGEEVHYSGLQRDRVIRLFHRDHARYPNRRVHADLVVDGPVGHLKSKMLHYYIRSFDHMIEKMTRYGVWGATTLFLQNREASRADILARPLARFFRDFVVNRGFLDGARGLIVVGLHTYYTFWKYAKLWEFHELKRQGKPVTLPELDLTRERWTLPWEENASASEQ